MKVVRVLGVGCVISAWLLLSGSGGNLRGALESGPVTALATKVMNSGLVQAYVEAFAPVFQTPVITASVDHTTAVAVLLCVGAGMFLSATIYSTLEDLLMLAVDGATVGIGCALKAAFSRCSPWKRRLLTNPNKMLNQ